MDGRGIAARLAKIFLAGTGPPADPKPRLVNLHFPTAAGATAPAAHHLLDLQVPNATAAPAAHHLLLLDLHLPAAAAAAAPAAHHLHLLDLHLPTAAAAAPAAHHATETGHRRKGRSSARSVEQRSGCENTSRITSGARCTRSSATSTRAGKRRWLPSTGLRGLRRR